MGHSLWGKLLFFVSTCALIVAGANSEINPQIVETPSHFHSVRCEGTNVVFYPNENMMILDGEMLKFSQEDVLGQYPARIVMRLNSDSEEIFVLHAERQLNRVSYRLSHMTDQSFKPRLLRCAQNRG